MSSKQRCDVGNWINGCLLKERALHCAARKRSITAEEGHDCELNNNYSLN
jgi:hypothetical protein